MKTNHAVEWNEIRMGPQGMKESFYVIAEQSDGKWRFCERGSWDILWREIPATPKLLSEVEQRKRCERGKR
jgi:hypothetical protein